MNIRNNQKKISVTAFNKNNFLNRKNTPNIKSFSLKKNISENNNIQSLNNNYFKKCVFTKCRNNKTKSKLFINIDNDFKQNYRANYFNNIYNTEIKTDNEHTYKNKSSDNLSYRMNVQNNFTLQNNKNINQMHNPIYY